MTETTALPPPEQARTRMTGVWVEIPSFIVKGYPAYLPSPPPAGFVEPRTDTEPR